MNGSKKLNSEVQEVDMLWFGSIVNFFFFLGGGGGVKSRVHTLAFLN